MSADLSIYPNVHKIVKLESNGHFMLHLSRLKTSWENSGN